MIIKSQSAVLLILVSLFTFGCGTGAGVPQPPTLELYLHFQSSNLALCSRTDGSACPALPMSETDRFFMLKPRDWESLNNYIDLLILQISDPNVRAQVIQQKRLLDQRLVR